MRQGPLQHDGLVYSENNRRFRLNVICFFVFPFPKGYMSQTACSIPRCERNIAGHAPDTGITAQPVLAVISILTKVIIFGAPTPLVASQEQYSRLRLVRIDAVVRVPVAH